MKYKQYIPAKLNGIVEEIWEHEMPGAGKFIILPTGKVELLFPINSQDNIEAKRICPLDNPMKNHSCFLSGLHTKPLKLNYDHFHTFGIRMRPVAVKALFSMPLSEIRDYFVDGSTILTSVDRLVEKVNSLNTFSERAQWFEQFMLKKINETVDLHVAINLNKAMKKYIARKKKGHVKSIEDLMGYSRTHTFRLFNEWFGISAHAYQKLLQFIRAPNHYTTQMQNSQMWVSITAITTSPISSGHLKSSQT